MVGCGLLVSLATQGASASTIFDTFGTNLGHFTSGVTNATSSANLNLDASSTHARTAAESYDGSSGVGADQINIVAATPGSQLRLRHLSGGGTPANNTAFTTSSGVDGWIGVALKTSVPGYTVQLFIEGASNNGGIEKTVNADGDWHVYEWNLDDNSGGANGWGTITSIVTGVATVADGSHTVDSVIFRNASGQTGPIFMDFVAKSDTGSIAALVPVPEPGMLSLACVGAIGLFGRRRKA